MADDGPLPITFLSDYGLADDFVGVCHAVIARIAPAARVIDLTHGIYRHDVSNGGAVLADAVSYIPAGVHLAIVDPGVGGDRRPVAVRAATEDRLLVGPDNGLLSPAIEALGGAEEAVDLSGSDLCLDNASATFHGRDVFAPVAAHLAIGTRLSDAGEAIDPGGLERHAPSRPRIEQLGAIVHADRVDGFGNVALDLTADDLRGHPLAGASKVTVAAHNRRRTATRGRAFEEAAEGAFIFYEDPSGRMAVAVNRGSASEVLSIQPGDEIELEPAP